MDKIALSKTGLVLPLVVLVSVFAFFASCGDDEELATDLPEQTENEQQTEIAQQEEVTEEEGSPESDEFDISNRDQAAARLSYLYDILSDGNPISDPIGWAKAGAAGVRIQEICNNFDISEDLDPACDNLLIALETPFNQIGPVLTAAASELRSIIPRRKLAEYEERVRAWDGDISDFEFGFGTRIVLQSLKDLMDDCVQHEFLCDGTRPEIREFTRHFSELVSANDSSSREENVAISITIAAVSDLTDYILEFTREDSSYGRQLDANRIADELEDLGAY